MIDHTDDCEAENHKERADGLGGLGGCVDEGVLPRIGSRRHTRVLKGITEKGSDFSIVLVVFYGARRVYGLFVCCA